MYQDDHADDDEGDNDDDDGAPPKMMRSRHCLFVLEDVNSDGDAPPGQVDDTSSISLCGVCCYSVCLAFLWSRNLLNYCTTVGNKKLSYRRGTARRFVSVEILPIATQQYRNYLYDKS